MLEYKGYHAEIAYDADDDILVGSIVGINDSINFHGSSIEEIAEIFHRSVDDYLEICNVEGRSPDKMKENKQYQVASNTAVERHMRR